MVTMKVKEEGERQQQPKQLQREQQLPQEKQLGCRGELETLPIANAITCVCSPVLVTAFAS